MTPRLPNTKRPPWTSEVRGDIQVVFRLDGQWLGARGIDRDDSAPLKCRPPTPKSKKASPSRRRLLTIPVLLCVSSSADLDHRDMAQSLTVVLPPGEVGASGSVQPGVLERGGVSSRCSEGRRGVQDQDGVPT